MSRLGDVGLVHHFEQVLNSCLRESIYRLCPMPRTWVEWKCEASILDNQWRQFNATCPQMMMSKNPTTSTMTPMHSAAPPPSAPSSTCSPMLPAPSSKLGVDPQPMAWIVQSPRTHLRPVTTVTSWGTLPGTVQNPMHIKCAMQTPCLQRPSKQLQKL